VFAVFVSCHAVRTNEEAENSDFCQKLAAFGILNSSANAVLSLLVYTYELFSVAGSTSEKR